MGDRPLRYRAEYTDGAVDFLEFETDAAAWSFAQAEGDHLVELIR